MFLSCLVVLLSSCSLIVARFTTTCLSVHTLTVGYFVELVRYQEGGGGLLCCYCLLD